MVKLIGVDTSFKAPSIIDQPIINASDFRGEAFGVMARANQAALEAQKNRIINQSSTDLALSQQRVTSTASYSDSTSLEGRGRGSSSKEFDPALDVSEREKWEFEKQKSQAEFELSKAKFMQDAGLDERKFNLDTSKFGLDVSKYDEANRDDERDFNYRAGKDELEYLTVRIRVPNLS